MYIRIPASVAYSLPPATAPRVPREGSRTVRFGGCRCAMAPAAKARQMTASFVFATIVFILWESLGAPQYNEVACESKGTAV
jgi:hypothetical protein